MSNRFLDAFLVRLIYYLLIIQPTDAFCQGQSCKKYDVGEAWSNYCPAPEDAMLTYNTGSRLECAAKCFSYQWCINFSYYATSRLCYFYSFVPLKIFYNSDCIFMMDRSPLSGGPQNGRYCQQQNVFDFGEGPVLLPTVNNWIIFLNRFDGSLDFNRNWSEYKNGFKEEERGEFWLGNEKVYRLTSRVGTTNALRVEVQLNATGDWFYAEYATFSLNSESNKYVIHLSGYSGNAGNALSNTSLATNWQHNGRSFTTMDADNDRYSGGNCAQLIPSGWWFDACAIACLTCPYRDYFMWYNSAGWQSSGFLRAVRMMIKSI